VWLRGFSGGRHFRPTSGERGLRLPGAPFLYAFKVVFSGFFLRGACLEGLEAEPTPKELCLHATFRVWVESTGVCFQSLARRSRYSIRPLKFECDYFLGSRVIFGSPDSARHLSTGRA
jgi:hypothetical protein